MANHTKRNTGKRYGRQKKQRKKAEKYGAMIPVLTESYGLFLLQETAELINADPQAGLLEATKYKNDFGKQVFLQKTLAGKTLAVCMENMSAFLEAFSLRLLGRTLKATELTKIYEHKLTCWACKAEYYRFISGCYMDAGDSDLAKTELEKSLSLYSKHHGHGHNLSSSGKGSCLFSMAHIYHTQGDNRKALTVAKKALEHLSPSEPCRALYFSALVNIAVYYFFDGRPKIASRYLEKVEKDYRTVDGVTVPRMVCSWLRGLLCAIEDLMGAAERHLRIARECAASLGAEREGIMIAADLMAVVVLTQGYHALWMLKSSLDRLKANDTIKSERLAIERAINAGDMSATWQSILDLRHYAPENESVVPAVLPAPVFVE